MAEDVNEQLRQHNHYLDLLKYHIVKAQNRMKQYANAHRRDLSFQPSDLVWLILCPYRLRSLAKRINEKLATQF